jgi:hypothetical protein
VTTLATLTTIVVLTLTGNAVVAAACAAGLAVGTVQVTIHIRR